MVEIPAEGLYSNIMYAIAFDFDTALLRQHYGKTSWENAYGDVRKFLAERGFTNQQGSLYYGDGSVTQVSAVLAVVEMSRNFPYLKNSIQDIRILQLVTNDDLRPALEMGNPG